MINFFAGGMMGDFIQTLYAVKNICNQKNDKANLYIGHGGDVWKFGLDKTYNDVRQLIESQHYINKFDIMPNTFNEQFINLNTWRQNLCPVNPKYGTYDKCWSEVLSKEYNFVIPQDHKWVNIIEENDYTKNKILIHRSKHRHNNYFPWQDILSNIKDEALFITTDKNEWNMFPYKTKVKLHLLNNITEMANAINSCKLFIGNQSAPLSLASSLDVPRLIELDFDPAGFYINEEKYSKNVSWFLNNSAKFIAPNCIEIK